MLTSGSYTCTIAGDELGWLFAAGGVGWNGIIEAGSPSMTVNPSCLSLKCGGVDVVTGASGTIDAQVSVDGVMMDENGDESPTRAIQNFKVEVSP